MLQILNCTAGYDDVDIIDANSIPICRVSEVSQKWTDTLAELLHSNSFVMNNASVALPNEKSIMQSATLKQKAKMFCIIEIL